MKKVYCFPFGFLLLLGLSAKWGQDVISSYVGKNTVVTQTIAIVDNDSNHGHGYCGNGSNVCSSSVIDTTGGTAYHAVISSLKPGTVIQSLVNTVTNNGTSIDTWTCPASAQVGPDSGGAYLQGCDAISPAPNKYTKFYFFGASNSYVAGLISIWKGSDVTSAAITASSGLASAGNVGSIQPGSVTVCAGCLTVTGWGSNGSSSNLGTTPIGYTVMDTQTNTAAVLGSHAYLLSGSSPQNPAWTLTSGTEDMTANAVVLKPMVGNQIHIYDVTSGYTGGTQEQDTPLGPFAVVLGQTVGCFVHQTSSSNTAYPTGITDSAGNTFTDAASLHATYNDGVYNYMGSFWTAPVTVASSSDVITVHAADTTYKNNAICFQELLNTSTPIDTASEVTAILTVAGNSITSPSFNTLYANEDVWAFVVTAVAAKMTFTAGTGYNLGPLDYNAGVAQPPTDILQQAMTEHARQTSGQSGLTASATWANNTGSGATTSDAMILVVGLRGQ